MRCAARNGGLHPCYRSLKMSYISFLLVIAALLVGLSIVWTTLRVGIPPMPSSSKATRAILSLIPVKAGERIAELGSGWGGLALAVTRHQHTAQVVAYELSLLPWLWSIAVARLTGRQNIEFIRGDFFDADLTDTDVVLCYLFPDAMERLAKELRSLKPGSIIISNTFRLPGWQPDELIELDDLYRTRIYRYVVNRNERS